LTDDLNKSNEDLQKLTENVKSC